MKLTRLAQLLLPRERTIAVFGMARLVKNHHGRINLVGGSIADRRAAREWCSHFMHNAVIDVQPHRAARAFSASNGEKVAGQPDKVSTLAAHNRLQAA